MIIAYLAAPLSPVGDETLAGNLAIAKKWYAVLSSKHRDHVFVADWILHCEVFAGEKDDDHELRSLGMMRNFKLIEQCHEIWLVGPRLSNGMRAELEYAQKRNLRIENLTGETIDSWTLEDCPSDKHVLEGPVGRMICLRCGWAEWDE